VRMRRGGPRKRRLEEGKKWAEHEKQQLDTSQRRLGVIVADAAVADVGGGTQKQSAYQARKHKSQPNRHGKQCKDCCCLEQG
jgi:hypothetical protein